MEPPQQKDQPGQSRMRLHSAPRTLYPVADMSAEPAAIVREATTPADFQAFAILCRQYVDWCRERYKDLPWFVEETFGYQDLEKELQALAEKYGPPHGKTLLAELDGAIVGGGAWRRTAETTCEVKRVFVVDKAKGRGLGRRLVEALIRSARADGFRLMQLDTGNRLTEAIAMYTSMGFERCSPYQTYPEKLMPFLVFMQKTLEDSSASS